MSIFTLSNSKVSASVYVGQKYLIISVFGDGNPRDYTLLHKHYDKLKGYKSVSALVKYAEANQIPPTVNTDNKNLNSNENDPLESVGSQGFDKALGVVTSEGEAPLSVLPSPEVSNDVLVSSIETEGNPSYVAGLSSTISSNTPLKTWEQQAKQHEINQIIKKYPFIKRASDLEGVA